MTRPSKFILTVSITFLLPSYHWCVRYT